MIPENNVLEQRESNRVARELRIRRVNVDVAGLVIYTSNISRTGAQLVCPAVRFAPLREQLNAAPVHLVIELPTGRDLSVEVTVRYACECGDKYLVGVEFTAFRDSDAAGWFAYIDWINNSKRG